MRIFNITLDMKSTTRNPVVWVRMGDVESTQLKFIIQNAGQAVDLSGYQPYFECVLPSGLHMIRDANGFKTSNLAAGELEYTLTPNIMSENGKVSKAYISLEKQDESSKIIQRITTTPFRINILQDAAGSFIFPSEGVSDILELKGYLGELKDGLEKEIEKLLHTLEEETTDSLEECRQHLQAETAQLLPMLEEAQQAIQQLQEGTIPVISQWEGEFKQWFNSLKDLISTEAIQQLQNQMNETLKAVRLMEKNIEDFEYRIHTIEAENWNLSQVITDVEYRVFMLEEEIF